MEKLMLILALGTFGFANAEASSIQLSIPMVEQPYQDDHVEIDEGDLPQAVQDAMHDDIEVSGLEIRHVYQIRKKNKVYYKIKFEEGSFGEELTRMYNAAGQQVEKGEKDQDEFYNKSERL